MHFWKPAFAQPVLSRTQPIETLFALADMKGKWGGSMSDTGSRFHAALAKRIRQMGLKLPSNVEVRVEQ